MIIGGFQKVTLIDYPGKIASAVFTRGCNFRCPYCHNPELVIPGEYITPIPEQEVLDFLKKRVGKIDAVVITGGEPTIQPDLADFMIKIKQMGFLIKLDTNGSNPDVVEGLIDLELIDFIAMDVKAPIYKYSNIAGANVITENILQSINVIINSGIKHEFRTTVLKTDLNNDDIIEIGKLIKDAENFAIQRFTPTKTIDRALMEHEHPDFTPEEFDHIKTFMKKMVANCSIR